MKNEKGDTAVHMVAGYDFKDLYLQISLIKQHL